MGEAIFVARLPFKQQQHSRRSLCATKMLKGEVFLKSCCVVVLLLRLKGAFSVSEQVWEGNKGFSYSVGRRSSEQESCLADLSIVFRTSLFRRQGLPFSFEAVLFLSYHSSLRLTQARCLDRKWQCIKSRRCSCCGSSPRFLRPNNQHLSSSKFYLELSCDSVDCINLSYSSCKSPRA